MKHFIAMMMALVMVFSLCACGQQAAPAAQVEAPAAEAESSAAEEPAEPAAKESYKIGYAAATVQEGRWRRDIMAMEKVCADLGNVELTVMDANNDAATQANQIENMIAMGCDAILLGCVDSDAAVSSVEACKEAGIPVIAQGREIYTSELDAFNNFCWEDIGYAMGEEVMNIGVEGNLAIIAGDSGTQIPVEMTTGFKNATKEKLDSGALKVVFEQNITNWAPDGAMAAMENCLTQNNNDIAVVFCHNDGMAGGAIQAIVAQGMNIPVLGMDSDPEALQRIAEGLQHSTILFDHYQYGLNSITIAIRLINGEPIDDLCTDSTVMGDGEVPTIMTPFFIITKDNMYEQCVKPGYFSVEEIYANVPQDQWPTE